MVAPADVELCKRIRGRALALHATVTRTRTRAIEDGGGLKFGISTTLARNI